MVYANDVDILGVSVNTKEKNTETLVIANKEIGIEVNADKTKYTVVSRDQNSETNHNIKRGNNIFEMVEQFQYLGTTPNESIFHSVINQEQTEVRECLLSFGAESSFFKFVIQKYKD